MADEESSGGELLATRSGIIDFFDHCMDVFSAMQSWQHLEPELKDDPDVVIAAIGSGAVSVGSFSNACITLRNNKEFMRQALELQPYLFEHAGPNVKRDFDLAVLAFGNSRHFAIEYCTRRAYNNSIGEFRDLQDARAFAVHVREQVRAKFLLVQATFCTAIVVLRREGLAPLNQGKDAANGYKMCLAELLGVPRGATLQLYRRAFENLDAAIPVAPRS